MTNLVVIPAQAGTLPPEAFGVQKVRLYRY